LDGINSNSKRHGVSSNETTRFSEDSFDGEGKSVSSAVFSRLLGSQSYIPPDPKDDKALHTALDLIRGIQKNSACLDLQALPCP
jgi:hypothetical protein